MSNPSLKEQLQAVASHVSDKQERAKAPPFRQAPAAPKPRTTPQKPKWLDHALYGIELLKAYFPNCFLEANLVKPLKKGIKQDLVKFLGTVDTIVTEDKACMVKSLTYYVNTAAYHKKVVEGAERIDLEGNQAGIVSAEEARYSAERQQAKREARQTASSSTQSRDREVITE